jgi:acetyl esterase/lipase
VTLPSPHTDPQATAVGPAPPFEPERAADLATHLAGSTLTVTPDLIPMLRDYGPPPPTDHDLARNGTFTVMARAVTGPEGQPEVPLVLCLPARASGSVPAVYFIHGGGMFSGDARSQLPMVLGWAEELGLAVVSVEYRLAPETPHPGPVEDCYAGLVWTSAHADELSVDPARIVVAGASAGGGLAAAVALLARDRSGPALAGQLLLCPMLDDRNNTHSARQMAGIDVWDRTANETGWTALLGDARGGPDVSPYAAPARAAHLSGLPPTYIEVGSAETLRDEGVAYAGRIWQAGGIAELHVWPGGFHGFWNMAPKARMSRDAFASQIRWLRRLLGP